MSRLLEAMRQLKAGRDVELPYMLDVKLGKEVSSLFEPGLEWLQKGAGAKPFEEQAPYTVILDQFTYAAHLYFYTGQEAFARRAREAILTLVDREPKEVENQRLHPREPRGRLAPRVCQSGVHGGRSGPELIGLSTERWRGRPRPGGGSATAPRASVAGITRPGCWHGGR